MKLNDILTLLNAGYTKEDIDKLLDGDPAPATAADADPEPTPAADPAPTPAPAPASDPASASAADPATTSATDPAQAIKTVLDDFTKKLQAFQIATSNMIPKPDDTGESVFAEIIAPTRKE